MVCLMICLIIVAIGIISVFYYEHQKDVPRDIYTVKCPLCKSGSITLETYGTYDQFTDTLVSCDQCGHSESGLTEDF